MSGADPIVLIPGFMGSRLSRVRDNQQVWVDPVWALTNLPGFIRDLTLRSPDDPKLYPSGVLHDVDIADLVRVGVYRRLWKFALSPSGLGLAPSHYHEFAFDWRKGVSAAAAELDAVLVGMPDPGRPLTLVAHSQGGLVVARLFALAGPGAHRVGKVIALGCPFAGLLKTVKMIAIHSGVLADLLPHDPVRTLVAAMPGAYELMPSRTAPAFFTDSAGVPSTPFSCTDALEPLGFDAALLSAAGAVSTALPLTLPVPVRLIEGYGIATATSATLAGGLKVTDGIEGDGTCPASSLLAAQGTSVGGQAARAVFSVPFGEHVGLVSNDSVLAFLADDLLGKPTPSLRIAADVRFRVAVPGLENLLIIETRDGLGGPLGTGAPRVALTSGGELAVAQCPVEGEARWLAHFPHPSTLSTLTVTVPGVGAEFQPKPIHVFP